MSIKQNVDLRNRCIEKPKLRTYITFKEFGTIPSYIKIPMPFICRKYLALTRLSNLSIRIETGRFERPRIDENLRICPACNDGTSDENEYHVTQGNLFTNIFSFFWSPPSPPTPHKKNQTYFCSHFFS